MTNYVKVPLSVCLLLGSEDNGLTDAEQGRLVRYLFGSARQKFPAAEIDEAALAEVPDPIAKRLRQSRGETERLWKGIRDAVYEETRKSIIKMADFEQSDVFTRADGFAFGLIPLFRPEEWLDMESMAGDFEDDAEAEAQPE